ncbi:MAG: YggS family pyridoxal phosphate-dependent enzyme [Alistipes sp.]|nr:YggS family pyridoxal phosphate-dependent enzyme [Alistipes sp.]
MLEIACNLSRVRASLPQGVTLVAVSKTHSAEAIREAYDAGQRVFGESRPQELCAKHAALPEGIEWHMIGHLQTNKVKYIAPFVRMIQSVDSARLAETIQREASKCGRTIDILLEIHVAQEETKSGWDVGELKRYLDSAPFRSMPNIRVRGIMGIATNTDDEAVVRRDFGELKRCFDLLRPYFGAHFDTLSMGMSHDFPLAVACGATMVRVGSSIFGERAYAEKEEVAG